MQKVIVIIEGAPTIYDLVPPATAATVAAGSGVTDPSLYQEFPASDFDPACYFYTSAFSLSGGVVSFDLAAAKVQGSAQVKSRTVGLMATAADGYSGINLAAQGALAEIDRLPEVQTVIDSVNALAVNLSNDLAAIAAATTIGEIDSIVNP